MTGPTHDESRSEPATERPGRHDGMDEALVDHTFAHVPTSMIGVSLTAWVFAFGTNDGLGDRRIWTWMAIQSCVLAVNLAIYASYRQGRFRGRPLRARAFHRIGVLLAGLAWALAGILFPLDVRFGPGFALLFCYSGMCAGGATTLAGDPVAYVLFGASALAPYVVQSVPHYGWMTVLLLSFLAMTTLSVVWNGRSIRESLALRFENVDLLRRAIRERESALDARAAAERAAEAKSRFLAAASHDLRQPAQALSLFVDVLQSTPPGDVERHTRAVSSLARATDALRGMIEGLLDLSRLDAGVVKARPLPVPLAPLLDEIRAALRYEADANDVIVHAAGRTSTVLADPVLLSRVVHNLATNAVRHGGRGRVLLAIRRHADHASVQVWDQGAGIAPADRERIFDEFVQLGNAERDREKGLGLGLPIVRRICDQNGWDLRMRSEVGRGTVFSIRLPLAPDVARAATDRSAPASVGLGGLLLVEDDPLVAEATRAFLEAGGAGVRWVTNAADAEAVLDRCRDEGVVLDAVVTDLRLPGDVDGLALVRRMRARAERGERAVPAILVTGDDESSFAEVAQREGILVLRKPVAGDALRDALATLAPGAISRAATSGSDESVAPSTAENTRCLPTPTATSSDDSPPTTAG